MKRYTESHEWIAVDDSTGTVGITDYAQAELGELVYIELPEVGRTVNAGDEVVVLESTKAAADVYTPVSGKITEVNQRLSDAAETVNESPEDAGWLFKIALHDASELEKLLDETKYQGLVGR